MLKQVEWLAFSSHLCLLSLLAWFFAMSARLAAIFKQCFCFDVVIASKSLHVKQQGKLTGQREYVRATLFYEMYLKIKMCLPDHLNVQYQLFRLCQD